MSYINHSALVSAEWLKDNLSCSSVKVVDATWYLPNLPKNARSEYEHFHIPKAVFFDIDEISDKSNFLPHMLPMKEQFSDQVSELGISNDDKIIIYDVNGGYSAAARVWWMFRVFGHENVCLLNGGFSNWVANGYVTETGFENIQKGKYTAELNNQLVSSFRDIMMNLKSGTSQIVDARSEGRFFGTESEPRPNIQSGHIPNSLNLPVSELFEGGEKMLFKPFEKLKRTIEDADIQMGKPIITTCGSGVTAAALCFAFYLLGHETSSVYDGSWSEWGVHKDTPKIKFEEKN